METEYMTIFIVRLTLPLRNIGAFRKKKKKNKTQKQRKLNFVNLRPLLFKYITVSFPYYK